MIVRHAKITDVHLISEMVNKNFDKFIAPTFTAKGANKFRNEIISEKAIHKRMKNPYKRYMFVAEEDSEIIGFIEGSKNQLWLFFVREEWMGHGIGSRLLTKLESTIREKGSKFLHVDASLFGSKIYKKLGFKKTTGVRKKNGEIYQPMKKTL